MIIEYPQKVLMIDTITKHSRPKIRNFKKIKLSQELGQKAVLIFHESF